MRREEHQFDGDGQSHSADREELRSRTHLSEKGMDNNESLVCETDGVPCQRFSTKVVQCFNRLFYQFFSRIDE